MKIASKTICVFCVISSFVYSMEYRSAKMELKKHLEDVKCNEKQEGWKQTEAFAHKTLQLFEDIKKCNGVRKICTQDIVFLDDTIYTLLAKCFCANKNCITCLEKFYFLLRLPEDRIGKDVLGLKCSGKLDKTFFFILCERGQFAVLSFLILQNIITKYDLYKCDKLALSENERLLEGVFDKRVFETLKQKEYGIINSCPKIIGVMSQEMRDLYNYVFYLDKIIMFYIESGVKFNIRLVKCKMNDILFKLRSDLSKLKHEQFRWGDSDQALDSNDEDVLDMQSLRMLLKKLETTPRADDFIDMSIDRNSYPEIIKQCDNSLEKYKYYDVGVKRINKYYDVVVVTEW